MYGSHGAPPTIKRRYRRAQIILKKPGVTVHASEKPNPLIAALPCRSGKKRRDGRASAWPSQQASEEIPSWTEECNQPFADWPGIVTGAAIERRRRYFSGTAR